MADYTLKHGIIMGGLVSMAFDPTEKYLFVTSHNGRGVFDISTGDRIARDSTCIYPENGKIEGIGPLLNSTIQIEEYDGENNLIVYSKSKRYRAIGESSYIYLETRIDDHDDSPEPSNEHSTYESKLKRWQATSQYIAQNNIDGAITYLENLLNSQPHEQFKSLIGNNFSNPPSQLIDKIDTFIERSTQNIDLKAIYIEMNGFDINYDLWYFNLFAYDNYRTFDDNDWLSFYACENNEDIALTGLEPVQNDFKLYDKNSLYNVSTYSEQFDISLLLVLCRFLLLIDNALKLNKRSYSIPILASAHDFDIVAVFK